MYGKRNINFGIYTTKSASSIIEGKMLLQGIHEYAYETNLDIPNEELDLILHLKLLTFENSGRDMRFPICGPHERYYFTMVFVLPEFERGHNHDSLFSCIIHDENVVAKVIILKKVLREKKCYPILCRALRQLYNAVSKTEIIRNVDMKDEVDSKKFKHAHVGKNMRHVNNAWDRIPYVQTVDLVFGQDVNVEDLLVCRKSMNSEIYAEKYMELKRELSFIKKSKNKLGLEKIDGLKHSFYMYNLAVTIISSITCVYVFYDKLSDYMYGYLLERYFSIACICLLYLTFRSYCRFTYDRIILYGGFRFCIDKPSSSPQGIWSYCRLVQYGTFRRWGMKYIYFSQKDMTDEEFRKFKRKIIPHDYDSIAVPYKKSYMKIAEHLVFATRKDR